MKLQPTPNRHDTSTKAPPLTLTKPPPRRLACCWCKSFDEDGGDKLTPDEGLSGGAIAAAVIVPLFIVGAVAVGVYFMHRKKQKNASMLHEKAPLGTEMVAQSVSFQVTNPAKEVPNPSKDAVFSPWIENRIFAIQHSCSTVYL